jgi:hypothetical protein
VFVSRVAAFALAGQNGAVRPWVRASLRLVIAAGLITSVTVAAGEVGAAAPAIPIPAGPALVPGFVGHAAVAQPIMGIPDVPQNPFLAPNGNSGIHDDGFQSNAYTRPGPLGIAPKLASSLLGAECGSITFDHAGRIVATCIGVTLGLYLIDPVTLQVLARYALPGRDLTGVVRNPNVFQNFGGGGYFYLDNADRAVIGTSTGHVLVIAENSAGNGFVLVHDYDLTSVLRSSETLNSALPDSHGLLWFVARTDGVVGTLNFTTGAVHVVRLGSGSVGEIENSFAVGADGDVYIATNRQLYRFDAGTDGAPTITWRVSYPNSGLTKPGQVDDGTGTTPAILPGGFVAITDNADPMDVVVYRTAAVASAREVCAVPVFGKGASDTENSLIAAGRSLIVENNFGYTGPTATLLGGTTRPGFARVDITPSGTGCALVWTNSTLSAPSVVPKLSLATGLIYTYAKTRTLTDPWYWTAIDFRTGTTVWKKVAGTGIGFNNNYAGLALGPNGTAYLGVLGGITSLRDGP